VRKYNHDGSRTLSLADLDALRQRRLVEWAVGKCEKCGSTLTVDPLGHRCGKAYARTAELSMERWNPL